VKVTDSIKEISRINLQRCLRWHPDGINSWSLSDWAVAVSGEVGELCNVVKKLNRERDGLKGNKESMTELQIALWKEVADVYLYLDLFAQAAKMDLATAIAHKFDEVSIRNGFPERLGSPASGGAQHE
jgi:NTP pyrophosphatase (non-canonical NTP hydrolase)